MFSQQFFDDFFAGQPMGEAADKGKDAIAIFYVFVPVMVPGGVKVRISGFL